MAYSEKVIDHYKSEQEILSQADNQSSSEIEFSEGRLLASLSTQHREVLVLTKIIGYSIAEAAEKIGISESAVKVRVHRAIRRLQQSLARDEL
jgi:RNA polymerase sigma-70 factor (ECF subfamily)